MSWVLVIVGLVPFVFGGILNWAVMEFPHSAPPFLGAGIVFLLLWGIVAYFMKRYIKSIGKLVALLNLAAFILMLAASFVGGKLKQEKA